jgi:hypothetical protein
LTGDAEVLQIYSTSQLTPKAMTMSGKFAGHPPSCHLLAGVGQMDNRTLQPSSLGSLLSPLLLTLFPRVDYSATHDDRSSSA